MTEGCLYVDSAVSPVSLPSTPSAGQPTPNPSENTLFTQKGKMLQLVIDLEKMI